MAPTLGSLFSGIGGIDLAAEAAGFATAFQVEIDAACQMILRRHWPDVPKFGDVTSVKGSDLGYCDVLVGGFPCQDLSVAGKRAGLGGSRSGLFFEFARLIRECRPRFAVIENVPGLLSSAKGRDFAVLLDTLGECGATDIGWRILDAQHAGVPQRRRRVVVIADFGTQRAGEVLSLAEGVRGNPAPRRAPGKDVAGTPGGGAGSRGWSIDTDRMTFVPVLHPIGVWRDPETARCLSSRNERIDAETETFIVAVSAATFDERNVTSAANRTRVSFGLPSNTLHQDGLSVIYAQSLSLRGREGGSTPELGGEIATALRASRGGGDKPYVLVVTDDGRECLVGVRRLTPLECERLQGFPDGWTDGQADAHRYRQAGNAVAVPVFQQVFERLAAVLADEKEHVA